MNREGARAEDLCAEVLRAAGLRLVERNWRCRLGEIDLIAEEGGTTVFAEVRMRSAGFFGGAAESVGANGDDLLVAYIKGWEVLIRAGLAAPGQFQAQGFQITSVGGTLGAALVAAELFRLDDAQSVDAVGIALSQASGVFEFLTNGSSVKSVSF